MREQEINQRVFNLAKERISFPEPNNYAAESLERAKEYDEQGAAYGEVHFMALVSEEGVREDSFITRDIAGYYRFLEDVRVYNQKLREIQKEVAANLGEGEREEYLDFNMPGIEIGIAIREKCERNKEFKEETYTGENEDLPRHEAKEQGPYGGAFGSREEYYRYRGIE